MKRYYENKTKSKLIVRADLPSIPQKSVEKDKVLEITEKEYPFFQLSLQELLEIGFLGKAEKVDTQKEEKKENNKEEKGNQEKPEDKLRKKIKDLRKQYKGMEDKKTKEAKELKAEIMDLVSQLGE